MKQIILKTLTLNQFQKFESRTFEFGKHCTDVVGDNGAGKTTIYSAFTWLLFGKDAQGREKFNIKRLVDGVKQDRVDVSVEGTFVIINDGIRTPLILKRVLVENWIDKTGRYAGDETKCYVDNVPKLVGEYQAFIASIISESEFRMLTSVTYFMSLKKEEQREYLCKMAGVKKAEDIVEANEEWKKVFYNIPAGRSIDDTIHITNESLKSLRDDLKAIRPSINALLESMPEEQNWSELEDQKHSINEEIQVINESISSKEEAQSNIAHKRNEINRLIRDTESKIRDNEFERQTAIKKSIQIERQRILSTQTDSSILSIQLQSATKKQKMIEYQLDEAQRRHDTLDKELTEIFNRYTEENNKEFQQSEQLICPLAKVCCTTPEALSLYEQKQQELRHKYNEEKAARLEAIQNEGKTKNKAFKENDDLISNLTQDLETCKNDIARIQEALAAIKPVDTSNITAPDEDAINAKYDAIRDELTSRKAELCESVLQYQDDCVTNTDELKRQRHELMVKYEEVVKQLTIRDQRNRINEQVERYKDKGAQLSSLISDNERTLNILTEIQRAVVDDASNRINALFKVTHWITTVQQKNGEYKDVCEPSINGVTTSINTAALINIGLDICSVISRYLGVFVPCFIEQRESVNDIIDMENIQIINLSVAPKGTPLTITSY